MKAAWTSPWATRQGVKSWWQLARLVWRLKNYSACRNARNLLLEKKIAGGIHQCFLNHKKNRTCMFNFIWFLLFSQITKMSQDNKFVNHCLSKKIVHKARGRTKWQTFFCTFIPDFTGVAKHPFNCTLPHILPVFGRQCDSVASTGVVSRGHVPLPHREHTRIHLNQPARSTKKKLTRLPN